MHVHKKLCYIYSCIFQHLGNINIDEFFNHKNTQEPTVNQFVFKNAKCDKVRVEPGFEPVAKDAEDPWFQHQH